ncbi:hypothetical protein B0H66DRAFT_569549 [Apodospora peruviana]|uniref:ABC transporter domain-containing protein n=1 Tax=Apodospora peruviana TaxID=516989 RepID=A0AAE0LZ80_9PEZI|nr:hypothetical protein B0H66DRAFT_569549 [Apodospora peruviana]
MGARFADVSVADLPQAPFYPQQPASGPLFLDTQACVCQLQERPELQAIKIPNKRADPGKNRIFWRCFGNQTEAAETSMSGKWFNTQNGDGNIDSASDIARLPIWESSNPPKADEAFRWDDTRSSLVEDISELSVWDGACTGKNRSSFSTSYYRALESIDKDEVPIDGAPCFREGAVPLEIQSVDIWQRDGCAPGFLCANNTVNSLPQYCPPVLECQKARLGRHVCEFNGKNVGMGIFEPIICKAGEFCNGKESIVCPKGTYCQPGAPTPTPCMIGSRCPAGSQSEQYLLPIGILIIIDVLLIIGTIVFAYRIKRKNNSKRNRSSVASARKGMPKGFAARITGYKQLHDDHHDVEMTPRTDATYMPSSRHQRDVWSGFDAAIDMPATAYLSAHPAGLDSGLTPEIRAFVDSMRKSTDAADIGLSFGYSQLACQPKGAKRPILQNVTGSIKRGSLTAVMGGSGAGKSTFVNVLMGKIDFTAGSVTVNGIPGKLKRYKKLIGYVPQDDIILPELTVYENILHSARIRLPRSWKDAEIRAHVDAVIDCLELSHVRDSLVGSVGKPVISGGQRKRASIGMELAAAPMAIFLDEPTSGLDATAASSIMRTLKALARLGISVIVIIHQPRMEIFTMIDDLILLASGQLIYEGPETEVQPFFEQVGFHFPPHANFGDVVTDIITGNGRAYKKSGDISKDALISHWAAIQQHYRQRPSSRSGSVQSSRSASPEYNNPAALLTSRRLGTPQLLSSRFSVISADSELDAKSIKSEKKTITRHLRQRGAPLINQTILCLRRAFLQQYRVLPTLYYELGLASLAGFLLGLAEHTKGGILFIGPYTNPAYSILSVSSDFQSVPELSLLTAIAIGLVSAAPGVRVFSEEMLLHRREAEAGHSRLAYFVAKSLSILPRMVLACLHFTTFLFLLAVPIINYWIAFLANLLYFYCIYGLASCISMVVRREDAPLFATMIALIVGILSGAAPPLSNVKDWHMEWLWRMSPGTWLGELYFGRLVEPFRYLYDVDLAAQSTGYHLDWLWRNMLVLLGIGSVYRILAFIGLFAGKKMRL